MHIIIINGKLIYMKKIIVLDGACAAQKDLNFDFLKKFGEVTFYERTSSEEVIKRILNADAEIVITNKVKITKEVIESCPCIKYITVLATGYNIIDTEYARKNGINVSNVPAYSTDSVVQHTFALILNAACKVSQHNSAVKKGEWASNPDFCLCFGNITELKGKTLGIIGYGDIGKKIALIAKAFGMIILINTRTQISGCVSKETIYRKSDIITLHCPLTQQTERMINKDAISLMKQGVIIINTARGGIIDENAVTEGLESGKIGFFAADVLNNEPPEINNPIINHKNTVITSHIAWATLEARKRLLQVTEKNISSYINGNPLNVIN